MNSRQFEETMENFWAALGTHVRDGGGGGLMDAREQILQGILAHRAETVVNFMADVPQDLAAMCSGVVGVRNRAAARAFGALKKRELRDAVTRMQPDGTLPLVVSDPTHPVVQLLEDLLASDRGQVLYRDVARILCAACEDTSTGSAALRAALHAPPKDTTDDQQPTEEEIHGGTDDREP